MLRVQCGILYGIPPPINIELYNRTVVCPDGPHEINDLKWFCVRCVGLVSGAESCNPLNTKEKKGL